MRHTRSQAPKLQSNANGSGDIDKMTAEGNVRITDPRQRVTGDRMLSTILTSMSCK